LFPSRRGNRLGVDAVEWLVAKHAATATQHCKSLRNKNITPHTLRHTAAMQLLHAGVDTSVIALWLGHETPQSTPALPACRPSRSTARPRPHDTAEHQTRPLPALPTRCSRSSKSCDYAELFAGASGAAAAHDLAEHGRSG